MITAYCGARFRPRQSVATPAPVTRALGLTHHRVLAGRFNLECFLGRKLESHEVCCHGPGGNGDHSKANLSVGCQLNNIIDSVIDGSIESTPESIDLAIRRLEAYYREITNRR